MRSPTDSAAVVAASLGLILVPVLASTAPSAMAQSPTCLSPQPVTVGDTPFVNLASYETQLSQSTSGFGEAWIYRAGWFAFTPDVTAQYIVGVCGASVDTKLALGAACPLAADSPWDVLGYNDDSCAFTGGTGLWASRLAPGNAGRPLNAELVAGQTYLIAVGGYAFSTPPATGSLSIEMVPPPSNPCASPATGVLGTNALAMDLGAPSVGVECGGILYDIYRASYLRFTPKTSGRFIASTCAQQLDTVIAVLGECGVGATSRGCNDDFCGSASRVEFDAIAGVPVYIAVGMFSPSALPPASIPVVLESAAPPVDPCATIGTVGLGTATLALDAAMPTLVIPTKPATFVYKANYFRFTAPSAGVYRVANCASAGFDSIVVRLGACGQGATAIEVNDDGCGVTGGPSRMSFFSEAGESHFFAIGNWSSVDPLPASTQVSMSFLSPPLDACGSANLIQGAVGVNAVPMSLAYRALDLTGLCDPGPNGTDTLACARYIRFTASRTGMHTVSNCTDTDPLGTGSVDARLAVLRGCGVATTVLACDDDGCTGGAAPYTSRLSFPATAGETYYIAVGGFDAFVTGPLHVQIEQPANPADLDGNGTVGGSDLALLLGNWFGTGTGDIDGDGIVAGSDLALLLGAWG
ncbi:MAG: hypothetical protein RL325_700 [Planctomycetota bacterium]